MVNKTGYIGVHEIRNKNKKYQARICVKGKFISLGAFIHAIDAAWEYDRAAEKYHGKNAVLNFRDAQR